MTFTCPRCGEPAEARFYGPCSSCVVELHELKPSTPDKKNYRSATLPNGLPTTEYVGPRVDRAKPAP